MKHILILLLCYSMITPSIAQDTPPPNKEMFSQAWGYMLAHVLDQRDLLSQKNNALLKQSLIKGLQTGFEAKKSDTDSIYRHRQSWFYGKEQKDEADTLKKAVFDYGYYEASHTRYFPHQISPDSLLSTNVFIGIDSYFNDWNNGVFNVEKADSICLEHIYAMNAIKSTIRQQEEIKKIAQNRLEAEQFLLKNKSKEGVLMTSNGMQYEIIKKGTGAVPLETDRIFIHYSSDNINNENLYNTNINEASPITIAMKTLSNGWLEGLRIMQKGSIYKFYMSSEFLYEKGYEITTGSTPHLIILTVELLDIKEDVLQTEKAKISYIAGHQYATNLGITRLIPNSINYTENFLQGFQKGFTPNRAISNKLDRLMQSIRVGDYAIKDTLITVPKAAQQWLYCFGHYVGTNFKESGMQKDDFDLSFVRMGFEHAAKQQQSWLDDESITELVDKIIIKGDSIRKQAEKNREKIYNKNIAAGEKFLADNSKKRVVTTLESGLQYQVVRKAAKDKKPTRRNNVEINYTAQLLDGTVIANSADLNEPVPVNLSYTYEAWEEGIPLMSEGATYKFFVSSEYDSSMHYRYNIPIGSTVIFEIELVTIQEAKKSPEVIIMPQDYPKSK